MPSKSREVLASAGVDLSELKTFFKSHKRRSSAAGAALMQLAPALSPEPAAVGGDGPLALEGVAGVTCSPSMAALGTASMAQQPALPRAAPLAWQASDAAPAAEWGVRADPGERRADGAPTTEARARESVSENASPNAGALHARETPDDAPPTGSGSGKKGRRKRRQSFSLREIEDRIREIAESGASPLPPQHGMPSPMVPMTPLAGLHLSAELSAASAMDVESPAHARMGTPARAAPTPPALRARPPTERTPVPAAACTPEVACSPCIDLEHARLAAPLRTCDVVIAHIHSAARHARLAEPDALRALACAVREVCTFAELWHWEEESRLAVRAADDGRPAMRRVRFCAMRAAGLEPPRWGDDGGGSDAQRAALDALLPALRASDALHASLARVTAAKLRRFLAGAAALVGADERLRATGAGPFWREQLVALARGERLYGSRCGALVRSLVRHELRAVAERDEAGEAEVLRTLPSPRAGPVLRAGADSVARLLSNGLRVWDATRASLADAHVGDAIARASDAAEAAAAASEPDAAVRARCSLPAETLHDVLAAADAHAALEHLIGSCAFVRAAALDECGPLRQLLELTPLVPGWADEFALLKDLGALEADLEHARTVCVAARALFPHGVAVAHEAGE
ncbi:hypothetical protein KFE25_012530 [Diacronema lutheri]|uniref:Uncharacterized protein n=1 Tax=Diacronema lutheri TaxID=2081491 RepID=A0A8J5XNG8_DIALT|nr:hypothetical protein KFE25_012530 [Diacronema lutheri]